MTAPSFPCPDPWQHRRDHENNETTQLGLVCGYPIPDVPGTCSYCGGSTVDAAAVAEALLQPDSPRFGPAQWDPSGEYWYREPLPPLDALTSGARHTDEEFGR